MADESPLCWICQQPVEGGGPSRVWITSDLSLPVHTCCWKKLPETLRVELAIKLTQRPDLMAQTLKLLVELLQTHLQGESFPFPSRN